MSVKKQEQRVPVFYGQGDEARVMGHPKSDNPYPGRSPAAIWWLAGWNDKDIEAKQL